LVAHKIPPPTRAIPAAMTSLAEARVTRIWAGPASASAVIEVPSQATPVLQGGVPEYLLHVQGAG